MVTIYDLSKITGFSAPTISKALNGTGRISEKTRKRIAAAAATAGYKPNITARTLRTQCSRLIGVINTNLYHYHYSPPLFSTILSSFNDVVETKGYDLLLLSNIGGTGREAGYGIKNSRHIDGMLILSMTAGKNELDWAKENGSLCVSTNDFFPGVDIAVTDNRGGGRSAVQHLIDLGHKKIAYLAGPVTRVSAAAKERRRGYHDALLENKIKLNPAFEVKSDTWHARGGYKACAELIARGVHFTALFAASNYLAFGAMKYMVEFGIKIPEDISVIGFDDGDGLDEYMSPSLSTMRQDAIQIGKTAADMLLRKLEGLPTERTVLVPAELIGRESSAKIIRK